MKRFRLGKSSALKAATKEAESELDVTSIMLAREQVTGKRMDEWIQMMMDHGERQLPTRQKLQRMKHFDTSFPGEE